MSGDRPDSRRMAETVNEGTQPRGASPHFLPRLVTRVVKGFEILGLSRLGRCRHSRVLFAGTASRLVSLRLQLRGEGTSCDKHDRLMPCAVRSREAVRSVG